MRTCTMARLALLAVLLLSAVGCQLPGENGGIGADPVIRNLGDANPNRD